MSKNENEVHVVMLPWLAFGHMIPFLDLTIALAKLGIHVSFLSTPKNIQRLPKIPPNLSPFIDFVPLSLPKLLPENAEATIDIPADKIGYLKIACDLLQDPVKNFIAKKLPNWIIVDFFPHWVVDITQDLSITVQLITFYMTSASTAAFFGVPKFGDRPSPQDLTIHPDWVDFPSKVAYTNHEAIDMHNIIYKANASGIPDGARLARLLQASRAIIIRTCLEFEAEYLELYAKLFSTRKPVFPVGFLLPDKKKKNRLEEPCWMTIFKWLDRKNPRSVVFVGFGSETKLTKEQIHEIAYGLEISGVPFLWALRKPDGVRVDDDDDDIDGLPPGFCTRTAAQGVVHIGWAPQREILGHSSIGGSFFHAGWGSIIEAMQYGHVLVFLPFIIDQPLNARLMVEKDLGIEVVRAEDGSFTRNDIANALRKAMVSEEGERLRARAKEAGDGIFGDHQLHQNYVDKFAEYLKNEAHVGM